VAESDSPHCRRLSHRYRGVVRAVIISGGLSDFCLNYSPTVAKLTIALRFRRLIVGECGECNYWKWWKGTRQKEAIFETSSQRQRHRRAEIGKVA
jgi:hypothetical protein